MPTCPQGTRPNRRLLGAYMLPMYAAYSLPTRAYSQSPRNSNDLPIRNDIAAPYSRQGLLVRLGGLGQSRRPRVPMQAFELENIISSTHAWVGLLFLLGANISTLTGQGLRAAWCLFPSCIDAKYLRALTPQRGGGVQVTPTSPRLNACRRVAVTLVGSCFLYAQNLNPGAKHVRHKLERSQARARSPRSEQANRHL